MAYCPTALGVMVLSLAGKHKQAHECVPWKPKQGKAGRNVHPELCGKVTWLQTFSCTMLLNQNTNKSLQAALKEAKVG